MKPDACKDIKPDKHMNNEEKEDSSETTTYLYKINEQINQVNLLARTKNDLSKDVEEILTLMNELHDEMYDDDLWLGPVELNEINELLDEALDRAWKAFYDKNRESHEKIVINKYRCRCIYEYISKYTDIIYDKLELVNRIGELLDSIMVEVQNVVDMVRKTDNDSLIYDILAEHLKKWKDDILELINSVNVCVKPDTKKKDNPNTSEKKDNPNTSEKKDKPNTSEKKDNPNASKKKDKPNTSEKKGNPNTSEKKDNHNISKKKDKLSTSKKKDKPNASEEKDNPNTSKKKDKPNTSEKKDKPNTSEKKDDIKKYNKSSKTLNSVEMIFKRFICEKFMDEKYYVETDKDNIVFYLIRKPIKGFKVKHIIEISKDVIILAIEKETKALNECITIYIIDNQIKLNIAQTENENKMNISIIISNDEIVCNISTITNEYQRNISEVTKCTDKIRYIPLMNIMYCIIKICDKKNDEINKKKKT